MSKRGPLDAYFAKLPNAANKKAKQAGDVAGKVRSLRSQRG